MTNQEKKHVELALLPVPNIVVLPRTAVTFALSDEKYVAMVKEVVSNKGLIVVSMTEPVRNDKGEALAKMLAPRPVSVVALPEIINENTETGEITVSLQGLAKVRITKITQTKPSLKCRVQMVAEAPLGIDLKERAEFHKIYSMLTNWMDKNIAETFVREELLKVMTNSENVLNYVSLFLVENREMKQLLLEAKSPLERFEILAILFVRGMGKSPQEQMMMANMLRTFLKDDDKKASSGH